ncbi:MAG: DegT/DnrJ/EryC1/StrS family aminotransferase, partial [Planctomycetaceae bacterium]
MKLHHRTIIHVRQNVAVHHQQRLVHLTDQTQRTGCISSVGAFVNRFEQRVAEYVGVKHAVATV